MNVFVTGASGFIGSTICDRLLSLGHNVIGYGKQDERFLTDAHKSDNFRYHIGNMSQPSLIRSMEGCNLVLHVSAYVNFGLDYPFRYINDIIDTFNVLESMRECGINRIVFTSSGSIYGKSQIPTSEDCPFPVQTSLYGASKMSSEAIIEAYCNSFGFEAHIFRLVSILGERSTHGHVYDLYRKLMKDPGSLTILGDGTLRKSYLYVHDCIDAILHVLSLYPGTPCSIFNVSTDESCTVMESVKWICNYLNVNPDIRFSESWKGDDPIILDTAKICSTGWVPTVRIRDAVERTLKWLVHTYGI